MGHHDHRHLLAGELFHDREHLGGELRIESGGRLVKEQDVRVHHQRPGNGDALLLAAGKRVRVIVFLVGKADFGKAFACAFNDLRLALARCVVLAFDSEWCADQILQHRHVREEVEVLKHHSHSGADGRRLLFADIDAVLHQRRAFNYDIAAVGALEIDKAAQHGAFSGAGRPDDRDGLALVDGEGNAVEHAQLTKALFKIVYLKIMHSKDLQTAESE